MQLFKRECDKHPFKPKYPEYREWGDATVTVLHPAEVGVAKKEISLEGLNERQKKSLAYLKENMQITNKIYQQICNSSKPTTTRDLQNLIKKKLIVRIGKRGRGVIYRLSQL